MESMPEGMTMPGGISLSFKLGKGFFANMGDKYPVMRPLTSLLSFLDALEFTTASRSPASLLFRTMETLPGFACLCCHHAVKAQW